MLGRTPPWEMTTCPRRRLSSSSFCDGSEKQVSSSPKAASKGGRTYADGELKVTGDDAGLLVVASGVSSELEDLSREVLEDSGEVDCSGEGGVSEGARERIAKQWAKRKVDSPGAPAPTR
jgi:hypothetical protein